MKNLLIMFLIVVCLLSFVGVSYSNNDKSTFKEFWNILGETEKMTYIMGVKDGILECIDEVNPNNCPELTHETKIIVIERVDFAFFIWENWQDIQAVMDDLYKDPANIYIQLRSMCEIAYSKLKGKDIEPLLLKAREEGFQLIKEKERNE